VKTTWTDGTASARVTRHFHQYIFGGAHSLLNGQKQVIYLSAETAKLGVPRWFVPQ
jgi:hypothetical protein